MKSVEMYLPKKNETKMIHVRVPSEVLKKTKEIIQKKKLTMTDVILAGLKWFNEGMR